MEKKRKGKTKSKRKGEKKTKQNKYNLFSKSWEKHYIYIYSTCNHHLVYTRYLHEQKATNDKNQELFLLFFRFKNHWNKLEENIKVTLFDVPTPTASKDGP